MLYKDFRHVENTIKAGLKWPYGPTKQDDYNIKVKPINFNLFGSNLKMGCPIFSSLDIKRKSNTIISLFHNATLNFGYDFYINFASASYHGFLIGRISKNTNKVVLSYFKSNSDSKIGAIVAMDFPNRTPGLIQTLIEHNFKQHDENLDPTVILKP